MVAVLAATLALAMPGAAFAGMTEDVKAVNDNWAHITYEMRGSSTQTKALDKLAHDAAALLARYPGTAEPPVWQGTLTSQQANRANIFHKLGPGQKALDFTAKASALHPQPAHGGGAMSLGVLYYKVPGSPLGFGDKNRAQQLLKEALALDPNGLDANYFYGDYLLDQSDKAGARSYLQKALKAPHDASRPAWDAGRRREVQALLAQAK